jgi:hypothetical protein
MRVCRDYPVSASFKGVGFTPAYRSSTVTELRSPDHATWCFARISVPARPISVARQIAACLKTEVFTEVIIPSLFTSHEKEKLPNTKCICVNSIVHCQ